MKGQAKYMPLSAVVEGQQAMIAQCETNIVALTNAMNACNEEEAELQEQHAAIAASLAEVADKRANAYIERERLTNLRTTLRTQLENYDA